MAIPFELTLGPSTFLSGAVASLASGQLDPILHPTGRLKVTIESSDGGREDGTVLIESFQIQSLLHYLANQSAVRQTAEAELSEARANWLRGRELPQGDVWSDSTLTELWLPCLKHNQFDGGGPETQSMYIVVFGVQWDDEHVRRTLKFRDDKFVSFGVDGE